MFRIFHSIKGISGMVELRDAEMLAHEMESYLRALRQREAILTPAGVDALVAGVDALERVIVARRENRDAPPISGAIAGIAAVVPGASSASAPTDVVAQSVPLPQAEWVVTFVPSAALSERGLNVDSVRARLRSHGTILQAAPKILPGGVAFEFGFVGELDDATREAWASDGMTVKRAEERCRRPMRLQIRETPTQTVRRPTMSCQRRQPPRTMSGSISPGSMT